MTTQDTKGEKKIKKIYKYPTGVEIPEGAIYLGTVTQTEILENIGKNGDTSRSFWSKCWLVWHYFLVEIKEEN